MDLRHISFRLLEVFMSVVKTGSISETARRLHLTQPTVSLQIKRLQEAVGEPLLLMQQQKLHVTDAGLELFKTCQQVFGHFDDYQDFLTELNVGHAVVVKLRWLIRRNIFYRNCLAPIVIYIPTLNSRLRLVTGQRCLIGLSEERTIFMYLATRRRLRAHKLRAFCIIH